MLSRTTTTKAAAAATVVGVLAWFGTRPETRRKARKVRGEARTRSRLVCSVVVGRPVVAFTKIHGTVDLTGTKGATVHDCDLSSTPHPSGAAVFAAAGMVGALISDSRISHSAAGVDTGGARPMPGGPGGDAPAGGEPAAAREETLAAWQEALQEPIAGMWEHRPDDIRHLPHDEQVKWVTDLVVGMYRALKGDLDRQAAETAGPADETPAPAAGPDSTPEV